MLRDIHQRCCFLLPACLFGCHLLDADDDDDILCVWCMLLSYRMGHSEEKEGKERNVCVNDTSATSKLLLLRY